MLPLNELFQESKLLNKGLRIEFLERLINRCVSEGDTWYELLVRMELFKLYRDSGRFKMAFIHYTESLSASLKNNITLEEQVKSFRWMSMHVDSNSEVSLNEINVFFDLVRSYYLKNGLSLRSYYQEKYNYLLRNGKWEEAFRTYTLWMTDARDEYSTSIAAEEADRAIYYFSIGDYQNGKYVFETVEKGIESERGVRAYAYPLVIRYFIDMKELERAIKLIQEGYQFNKSSLSQVNSAAEVLKPLSILNPKMAVKAWANQRYFIKKSDSDIAKISFGISAMILEKYFLSTLSGSDRIFKLRDDIKEMKNLIKLFDNKNGNKHYQEELEYWLGLSEKMLF